MRRLLSKVSGVAIATTFLMGSAASWADPVTISNHSFEDDVHVDGAYTNGLISGWILDQTDGVVGTWNPTHTQTGCGDPDDFIDDIPDGDQIAYSNGGEISQQTGATITAGHRYTLKVGVGGRCNLGGKDYAILLAGVTQVGTTTGTRTSPTGGWIEVTVVYNSPALDPNDGELLTVMLENEDSSQLNFDYVRLDDSEVLTCEGFFSPFDQPLSLKGNSKRAIPAKMVLRDAWGAEITDLDLSAPPVVQVMLGSDTGSAIPGFDGDLLPPGLADDGNEFRYDPVDQQWIINLATKQYTAIGTYTVSVVAGDGSYVVDNCSQTFERP